MNWLYLAVLAYFLDALVFVIDKYLLRREIPHPSAYSFFVAMMSLFGILLIPFGITVPPTKDLVVALVSGLSFFGGLLFLYRAIRHVDISEVMPAIGALIALATLGFSAIILPTHLNSIQIIAFVLLVAGTGLMSYFHLTGETLADAMICAASFGLSFVTLKLFFQSTDFVNGLFWTRWGVVAGGLLLMAFPASRREIMASFKTAGVEAKVVFFLNKVLAAAAFALLYYAIKIGNVVFVNAIQGVQYVFILLIGALLLKIAPGLFRRYVQPMTRRKMAATVIIIAGLALIFI